MKLTKSLIGVGLSLMLMTATAPATYADAWVKSDSGYVYEYDNGTTATKGWLKVGKETYYITTNGVRKTGWLTTKTAKYYFDKNGKMYKSKWLTMKSGTKYYLMANGKMATGVVVIDEIEYKFSDKGVYLGENNHFILNTETNCLHSSSTCSSAKKIKKANYSEVDIGSLELSDYSADGYWACGTNGCNDKTTKKALPKAK